MSFLRNSWYCVGWSEEIKERPKGIRALNEYLLIYRGESGRAIAMSGRCAHRFAPLDLGDVVGDDIICPYHGLRYGPDGMCNHNPHGDGFIPPLAKLSTYIIEERNTALWVWMGDADKVDHALLPGETALVSSDYSSARLTLKYPVRYELLVDNLLDLTHAPYIHRSTLASTGGMSMDEIPVPEYEFKREGDQLHSHYRIKAMPPSPQLAPFFTDPVGEFNAVMTWQPASILTLDLTMDPLPGGQSQSVHMPTIHYVTPETETTTHYFAAVSRNRDIHNKEADIHMAMTVEKAFMEEDEPMIRYCQEQMGGRGDIFKEGAAILRTDMAGVQARRLVNSKILAETSAENIQVP